jgi:hypothetical protein
VYRVFVGKPERNRPLGRPRRRWEDNTVLRWNLKMHDVVIWTELGLLRIETGCGHL